MNNLFFYVIIFYGDIMLISSNDNKKIKEIKKLNSKKGRDNSNLFLVEGEHLVKEAYKAGVLKTLILLDDTNFSLDVETIYVSLNVLKNISELKTPQPIIGICEKIKEKEIKNKILVLDNIQDPGNLGTIIRSAVAFNIDTIVLSDDTVDLYNSKVLRATQGMIFHTNIIVRKLKEFLPFLKNNAYQIIGTNLDGGKSIKSIEKNDKFAIIMGNEGNGVSEEIKKLCSSFIYIDMNNNCESLNVAVATSIILYEFDK